MNHDLRIAWTSSVALHLLLLLFALFATLPEIVRNTEFVELQWGTIASEATEEISRESVAPPPVSRPAPSTPAQVIEKEAGPVQAETKREVNLPERRLPDLSDDQLSISPQGEKLEAETGGGIPGLPDRNRMDDVRDLDATRSGAVDPGEKALPTATGAGQGAQGPGTGVVGSDVGYSVQWTGGGTRRRISGRLPEYPAGTNVRAQVLIRAVVAPNGTVLSVTPVQKANSALEEAAMSELRLWRFEALRSNVTQVDQDCIVTFVFTLQ